MKTELELRQLRVFVAVVETGTHTRAAQALGISQSTVSETLSALERTLGTTLLRKTPKGPMLTPSGEALLPIARQMLALKAELVAQVAKVANEVSATCVVCAVESLSAYVLPTHLAKLRARWPNVRMEVVASACAQIRESVAAGKSDLGLVVEASGANKDSLLANARLTIFGSATHALARGAQAGGVTPDELGSCTIYMSDAAGDYHQVLRQYFDAAQLPLPRVESLGSVEGVKRGVLATPSALGLLPSYSLEHELRKGTFSEIDVRPALPGIAVRAVIPQSGIKSPVVVDLIASLRGSSFADA